MLPFVLTSLTGVILVGSFYHRFVSVEERKEKKKLIPVMTFSTTNR